VVHQRSCKGGGTGSKPVAGKPPPTGSGGGGGRPTTSGGHGASASPARPQTREKGPAVKPMLLMCYLCGQQFGSSSLAIHVPQCYAKKTAQWEAGDPATRGKRPRDPATVDLQAASAPANRDEFNDQQFKQFSEDMAQCENCGRKFLPDRLVVHQRSCKGGGTGSKPVAGKAPPTGGGGGSGHGASASPARPQTREKEKGPAVKPMLLVCYLCGQQFGSSSLAIHVPQCYAKKTAQWEAGDPETRGKRPRDPATVDLQASSAPTNRDEFNDQQFKQFSEGMEQCENCGRKFLPDRLVVHQRSCKGGGTGSKPVAGRPPTSSSSGGGNGGGGGGGARLTSPERPQTATTYDGEQGGPQELAPCVNCGRKFLPDRLAVHLRSCKPQAGAAPRISQAPVQQQPTAGSGRPPTSPPNAGPDAGSGGGTGVARSPQTAKRNPLSNRRGRQPTVERVCSSCGSSEHDPNAASCDACGASLTEADEVPRCAGCSSVLPYNAKFCSDCGAPVGQRTDGGAGGGDGMALVACPDCGMGCDSAAKHCDECGASLSASPAAPEMMMCEPCGELFEPDSLFCEECGGELVPRSRVGRPAPAVGAASQWAKAHRAAAPVSRPGSGGEDDDEAGQDAAPPTRQRGAPPAVSKPQPPPPSSSQRAPRTPPPQQTDVEATYDDDGIERAQCGICHRQFNVDVLERHRRACEKAANSKRRTFDSRKHRIEGTELASVQRASPAVETKAKSDWRARSEDFRRSMKAARQVDNILKNGGTAKDLPPPTYSDNSHLTPCPYCGRRFNTEAAARHIPSCKNTVNKPKPPPKLRR
jgi:hypothetical protein